MFNNLQMIVSGIQSFAIVVKGRMFQSESTAQKENSLANIPQRRRRSVKMLVAFPDYENAYDDVALGDVNETPTREGSQPTSPTRRRGSFGSPRRNSLSSRKRASLGNAIDLMSEAVVRRLERQRALLQAEEHLTNKERRCKRLEEECLAYSRSVCGDGAANIGFRQLRSVLEENKARDVAKKMKTVSQGFQSRFSRWQQLVAPIRSSDTKVKKAYAGGCLDTNEGDVPYAVGTLHPVILPKIQPMVILSQSAPFSYNTRLRRYVTEPTTVTIPDEVINVVRPPAFEEPPLPRFAQRTKAIDESDDIPTGISRTRKSLFKTSSEDFIPRVPYRQAEAHLIALLKEQCPLEDNGCSRSVNDKVIDSHRHFRVPIARSVTNLTNRRLLMKQGKALTAENDNRLHVREQEMFHSRQSKTRFTTGSMGAFSAFGGDADDDEDSPFGGFAEPKLYSSFTKKKMPPKRKSVAVSIALPDTWEDATPIVRGSATLESQSQRQSQGGLEPNPTAQTKDRLVVSPRTFNLIKSRGPQHNSLEVLEGLTDALESNLYLQLEAQHPKFVSRQSTK